MGNLFGAIAGGTGGFFGGFTQGLDLMAKRQQLAAQEEHLKEQTKLLKAQQLLHEEQVKAKGQLAALLLQGPAVTTPAGTPYPAELGAPGMGGPAGTLQQPITSPGWTPQQILGTAMQAGAFTPEAMTSLLGLERPKVSHIDLGDSVGVVDDRGNLIARVPKGTPPQPEWMKSFIPGGVGTAPAPASGPQGTSAPVAPTYGAPSVTVTPTGPRLTFAPEKPQTPSPSAQVFDAGMELGFPRDMSKWTPDMFKQANARAAAIPTEAPTKPSEERESTADKLYGIPWKNLTQDQKVAVDADIQKRRVEPGVERLLALTREKPTSVLDTKNNNKTVTMKWGDVEDANAKEPGRYLQAGSPEAQLRTKAQFYGIGRALAGDRIFDTAKGKEITAAIGSNKIAFDPDTMVAIPKEKAADMQLALARRNSYVTLSEDIERQLGKADDMLARGQINAAEWAKRTTGSSVLWKQIAALNDHALTSMRVLTGGAPRSEMMLEISKEAFGNISPGTSREVIAQARRNFLTQMDEQIKGYQYGLQTPAETRPPSPGGVVPGASKGGAGGPGSPLIQGLRQKYGY